MPSRRHPGGRAGIYKIRLQVLQLPNGNSSGTIVAGPDLNHLNTAYSWNNPTSDRQWLEFSGDSGAYRGGNVRYIRVTVDSSPSWMGWREVEVYGGVEYFGYFGDSTISRDHMPETRTAGANLTHIFAQSIPDLATMLAEAKRLGVRAIVDLSDLLFTWHDNDPATRDRDLIETIWLPNGSR